MLPFSQACERNKRPILDVLRTSFVGRQQVLEIGSGTGQHAVYFAAELPHLDWFPTERRSYMPDLVSRVRLEGGPNLKPPALLDVTQSVWPMRTVDACFTANTLHIMSWTEVGALFRGIATVLAPRGCLCVYGPFLHDGRATSPSNEAFDRMLRDRDPASGVRDYEAVLELAAEVGLRMVANHDLPAFNRLLVFTREPVGIS